MKNKKSTQITSSDFKEIGQAPFAAKLIVLIAILLVVSIGGTYFLIKDKVVELEELENKELTLKDDYKKKQNEAVNLEGYEQQIKEMELTFGSMLKSLPGETEVEDTLVEISRSASSNNLEVIKFDPLNEDKKEFYAEYPIEMTLKGTYPELTGFLSSVAALERIVTLHDLKLAPHTEEGTEGLILVNLNAKTYRYISNEK